MVCNETDFRGQNWSGQKVDITYKSNHKRYKKLGNS